MDNEIDTQDVDLENNDTDLDLDDGADDNSADDKPEVVEKPKETPEARKARLERQLKRINKELGVDKPETKKESTRSEGLDYSQKAFLVASGYKTKEEQSLALEFMENTGKELEDIVESKFFQAEVKELRELKASTDAIPRSSKRSGVSSKDSVDYWLAKGELPENTPENQELRRRVVDAKYKRETSDSKFAPSFSGKVMRQSQLKK